MVHHEDSLKENQKEHKAHVLQDAESILLFIKNRLENNISMTNIESMLYKAGFQKEVIEMAIKEVHRVFPDTHQDVAASNNFLPILLSKRGVGLNSDFGSDTLHNRTIFSGRLHRGDFTLGFLFFFSVGILILLFLLTSMQIAYPSLFAFVVEQSSKQVDGLGLFLVPLALAPVTVMILSVISRRLHDIGMPDIFALGFLSFFIVPSGVGSISNAILGIQIVWAFLFTVLLIKGGDKGPNKYGSRRTRKGSFFGRLFASPN